MGKVKGYKVFNPDWTCQNKTYNSGDCNSGTGNSGNYNRGYWNSSNYNSGNFNIGDWNSGDWNMCSFSNGYFNTKSSKIYLFDKPSEWTYENWFHSEARLLLEQIPASTQEYIPERNQIWWDNLTNEQRDVIKALPNFNRRIFKKITGIDVAKS